MCQMKLQDAKGEGNSKEFKKLSMRRKNWKKKRKKVQKKAVTVELAAPPVKGVETPSLVSSASSVDAPVANYSGIDKPFIRASSLDYTFREERM